MSTSTTSTTTVSYYLSPSPTAGSSGGGGIPFQQLYASPQPTPSNYNYMHVQPQHPPPFQYQQSSNSGAARFTPPPTQQHFQGNWYSNRSAYPSADPSCPVAAAAAPQQPTVLPVGPLPSDNNSAAFLVPAGLSVYNFGGKGELISPSMSLSPRFHQWAPTKEARNHRRLVRQRSAALRATARQQHDGMEQRLSRLAGYAAASASSSASTPSSSGANSSSTAASFGAAARTIAPFSNTNINILPANDTGLQMLRFLLQKELRNSDVSHLGRIVLPKREAEMHLPYLEVKEGMAIMVRDVFSPEAWIFKYRFWPNNKSRMYVLENTGEFVKKYRLRCGDFIALYQDGDNQIYICAKKVTGIFEEEEDEVFNETLVVQSGDSSNDMNNDNFIRGREVQRLSGEGVGVHSTIGDVDSFDLTHLDSLPNFDNCDIYDFIRNEKDGIGGSNKT